MNLTREQQIRLARSEDFQRILQQDPVLAELELARFSMTDERAALSAMLGCLEYRLGRRVFRPLTPAVWAVLWASGSGLCRDADTVTAAELDAFFYLLSRPSFRPLPSIFDNLPLQSAGFLGAEDRKAAAELAGRIISDAFRPLLQLPRSDGFSGAPLFGADWLAAVITVVHSITGASMQEIADMPLAAVTTVFVAHEKKYDTQHRIFKMTDADAAKKILDRTGELAEEYLRKTE